MCPSWRATREERHATRGRGNALREAIVAPSEPNFSDPDLLETLDLCLSCKACRHECPAILMSPNSKVKCWPNTMSNKARRFEPSFRQYSPAARIGSRWHRWINPIQNLPLARYFTNHWLGLAPGRPLPFFKIPLPTMEARRVNHEASVILMADCFSCFYDSDSAWRRSNSWKRSDTKWSWKTLVAVGAPIFRSEGLGRPEKTSSKRLRPWKNSESDTPRWVLSHWNHPVPARCKKTGQN